MLAKSGFLMSHKLSRLAYYLYIGVFVLITSTPALATSTQKLEQLTIPATDQNEIQLEAYRAAGNTLFIWQPHELGSQDIDRQFARQLVQHGIEVWIADLLEAWYLPSTASSADRIPAAAIASLIKTANQSGKHIILGASGRSAVPVLRGLRQWQVEHPDSTQPQGVILLSPKLYVETPTPGSSGTLLPVAHATNIPIVLLQPDKSPWFWKLDETITALRAGGSEVYLSPVKHMRDRFYFRHDATEQELQAATEFHQRLYSSIQLLTALTPTAHSASTTRLGTPAYSAPKQERVLAPYTGNPQPPALMLPDLNGKPFDLKSMRGKVVLVNFWASWCPPCVHEMPSMQRLADHYREQPFSILGVNMAEDTKTIQHFLRTRVSVSFPIILDRDGTALKRWKVFAFPTSYVLDKQGRIRYALFGGIDWDTEHVKRIISKLLRE